MGPGFGDDGRWMVGDQLGELRHQVRVTADAMLGEQAIAVQVPNRSVEPGPVASITTVGARRPARRR